MFKKYSRFSTAVPKSATKRTLGLFTLIWCLLLLFMSLTAFDAESPESKPYDILINSYMRSGSSFTGQLLAFQPDTFYWYEPMLTYKGLFYFFGRYACVGDNRCCDCYKVQIEELLDQLHNIYSCNFGPVERAVAEGVTPYNSGVSWTPYLNCRAKNNSVSSCLTIMEDACKRSTHRATKIVRLTVDNLEYVLERQPNVKAIHLIRDPRAIMNSKITTTWYKLGDTEERVKAAAYDLCSRIKYDLIQGEKLKQKYPQRFAFVMYEDIQTDLKAKTAMLYSYFGIDRAVIESDVENITGNLQEDHNVNRTQGDYTNWWRLQLSLSDINIIDSVCGNVLSFLGYRIFLNESELKNISNKAHHFREDLLISSLNEIEFYDFQNLHNLSRYERKIDITRGTKIIERRPLLI